MKKQADESLLERYVRLLSEPESERAETTEERQASLTPTDVNEEREILRNKLMESVLKDKEQDRGERKDYASMIFSFMCWYMFAVFFIIILNGITVNHFHVSDGVILALLGTTAIEVIGTFAFVARYLFGNKS